MKKLLKILLLATPIIFLFLPLLWVSWKIVLAIYVMLVGLRLEDSLKKWREKEKIEDLFN